MSGDGTTQLEALIDAIENLHGYLEGNTDTIDVLNRKIETLNERLETLIERIEDR